MFLKKLKISVNQTLKKRKKIKVGKKGNKIIRAAEWVDQELMDNIKLRMKLNRSWRFSRKGNLPPIVQEEFKQKYESQRRITSALAGKKKSEWEKRKIEETWKDGKVFWGMIRELLGKNKEEEEAYIYTDEGERKEIMEIPEKFIGSWLINIYQKATRPDFSFWHGKEGLMEKMLNEEKEGNSDIMKFPTIEEKEFTSAINKMKNGKASGIDGISTEIMKFLIKDEDIKNYALKCFNNAIKEQINEDWLISKTKMIPKNKRPKILEHRPIAVTVNSS